MFANTCFIIFDIKLFTNFVFFGIIKEKKGDSNVNRILSLAISVAFVSYSFWIANALGYIFFRTRNEYIAKSCFRFRNQSRHMFVLSMIVIFISIVLGS